MIKILSAFLLGVSIGMAGEYYGVLFTERRRKKENDKEIKNLFCQTVSKLSTIILEIQNILKNRENELIRLLIVLPNRKVIYNLSKKAIMLYEEEDKDLQLKMQLLNKNGFIIDITETNAPQYEMTEQFVELLLKAKINNDKITF